jgi:hypothetical protein
MFQVGSRVADSNGILRAARPYLDDLAQRTGETIHLVTRLDNEVLYLYKEDGGAGYVRMASYVGLHNPMYCTGVGKSILAYLPEEELQRVWSSSQIVAHTPRTIIRLEDMLEEAARILRDHLQPFLGTQIVPQDVKLTEEEIKLFKLLSRDIESLDLSVRSMNCLSSANIKLLYQLCTKSEQKLLKFRNFGHKSLEEIKEKFKGLGLALDMQLSDRLIAALDAEEANLRAESEENK